MWQEGWYILLLALPAILGLSVLLVQWRGRPCMESTWTSLDRLQPVVHTRPCLYQLQVSQTSFFLSLIKNILINKLVQLQLWHFLFNRFSAHFLLDPNMVNAYMYQTAGTSGQPAAPGQAPPTTTPAYTNYQPTPTQGYQVRRLHLYIYLKILILLLL